MPDTVTVPETEPVTPVVTDDVVDETPETPVETTPEPTVAELQAQLAAERAKTAKAVKAEQALRARAQTAETELTGFKTAAETAEAERVANLGKDEQIAELRKKNEAAEQQVAAIRSQWTEYKIESDLTAAGFLSGLEGDAAAAQLTTLKALTGLPLVQEDGQFSLPLFEARFGSMKPAAPAPAPVAPPVVDLGGKTPPPAASGRKTELLTARQEAFDKGDRYGVMLLDAELSQLK